MQKSSLIFLSSRKLVPNARALGAWNQHRHHPSGPLAVTERNQPASFFSTIVLNPAISKTRRDYTVTFPPLNFSPCSLRGAPSFFKRVSYCKMQPLCNYVSTHVQSREKGGFRERETQYLAKSIGKSAQVIKPGRGHLTNLVEAMPFNPGYILSPRRECRKGLSPQNLITPKTLVSSEFSLSHFKGTHEMFQFWAKNETSPWSPMYLRTLQEWSLKSHQKLHSLCSYPRPQLNLKVPITENGGGRVLK